MIQFTLIGRVRNTINKAHRDTRWEEIVSEIAIDDAWREMLDGLEPFSHIRVVFYFDCVPASDAPRVRPLKRDDLPLVGIFETRAPQRHNPISIRAAELLAKRGNVVRVRELDALDRTPVLDFKPYLARGDAIENTRVGAWAQQFWDEHA